MSDLFQNPKTILEPLWNCAVYFLQPRIPLDVWKGRVNWMKDVLRPQIEKNMPDCDYLLQRINFDNAAQLLLHNKCSTFQVPEQFVDCLTVIPDPTNPALIALEVHVPYDLWAGKIAQDFNEQLPGPIAHISEEWQTVQKCFTQATLMGYNLRTPKGTQYWPKAQLEKELKQNQTIWELKSKSTFHIRGVNNEWESSYLARQPYKWLRMNLSLTTSDKMKQARAIWDRSQAALQPAQSAALQPAQSAALQPAQSAAQAQPQSAAEAQPQSAAEAQPQSAAEAVMFYNYTVTLYVFTISYPLITIHNS